MNRERLGIVGVGLIGGSIALRARASGAQVVAFDTSADALTRARERGAVDLFAPSIEALAAQCDVLVIALPVDATAAALEALASVNGPALIIDVASVKAPFDAYAGRVPNYLGTHPMAGRERGGIDAAEAGLFENATWAHVPHVDAQLVARGRAFIAAMGARPLEIAADVHDAIVALTSHLPQALSVVLGAELALASEGDERVAELCGPGMLSMLRLARSPQDVWAPIVASNARPLADRLRSCARALTVAADGLDEGDVAPLMSYFGVARRIAGALEERFVPSTRSSAYPLPPAHAGPATPPAR